MAVKNLIVNHVGYVIFDVSVSLCLFGRISEQIKSKESYVIREEELVGKPSIAVS